MKENYLELCILEGSLEDLLPGKTFSAQMLKRLGLRAEFKSQVVLKKAISLSENFLNFGLINPEYEGGEVDILMEDNDFVAFNKPPFVHNHPLQYSDKNNVLSFCRQQKMYKILKVNPSNYNRGLINRLDYETSGVLLYARNEETFQQMRKNFDQWVTVKEYRAIVVGDARDLEGIVLEDQLTFYGPKKALARKAKEKDAVKFFAQSTVKVKKYDAEKNQTHLVVLLKSGLKHQIRVQLSLRGFPILGDPDYGTEKESFKIERMFLHAYSYSFHYNKKNYQVTAPLPASFLQRL